jgi:hypothetical protein
MHVFSCVVQQSGVQMKVAKSESSDQQGRESPGKPASASESSEPGDLDSGLGTLN